MKKRARKVLVFILYLIFAAYFINYPLNFLNVPEFFSTFEPWIIFVGGILVLIGGIEYLRANKGKKELILSK